MDRKQIKQYYENQISPDRCYFLWTNFRQSGGLRLTDYGHHVFVNELNLAEHNVPCDFTNLNKTILLLDRKLTCPYYLRNNRGKFSISVFGESEATFAILHNDLVRYIKNLFNT